MEQLLRNYYSLQHKVDELCRQITGEFAEYIACHPGCDGCCRDISVFWVEAAAMATALRELSPPRIAEIRSRVSAGIPEAGCPLLRNGRCDLYEARPVICRTHGLPLLTLQDREKTVDFCPMNFCGISSIPGRAVIDLSRLNTMLVSVNTLFTSEFFNAGPPDNERLTISEALLLEL